MTDDEYEVLWGPFATFFASGVARYSNGDILVTNTNRRVLTRVDVVDAPVPASQFEWQIQVPALDEEPFGDPPCGISPRFGESCANFFKTQIVPARWFRN